MKNWDMDCIVRDYIVYFESDEIEDGFDFEIYRGISVDEVRDKFITTFDKKILKIREVEPAVGDAHLAYC